MRTIAVSVYVCVYQNLMPTAAFISFRGGTHGGDVWERGFAISVMFPG